MIAKKFFEKCLECDVLRNKLDKNIYEILGIDFERDTNEMPFDDIVYDYYDNSFELVKCKNDFRLTDEQLNKLWELGFHKCWLQFGDMHSSNYTEKFYYKKD